MAAPNLKNTEQLIMCPVCHESYKDPRILPECGHQFCLACLERVEKHTSRDTDSMDIACPTCRKVSTCSQTNGVTHLARPTLMNEVQEMLENYMESAVGRNLKCDFCEKRQARATKFCVDCRDKMCEECFAEHETAAAMADHQTTPASVELFCEEHNKLVINYCKPCDTPICKVCARKEHKAHDIGPMDVAAGELKKRIRQFLEKEKERGALEPVISKLKRKRSDFESAYNLKIATMDRGTLVMRELTEMFENKRSDMKRFRTDNVKLFNESIASLETVSDQLKENITHAEDLLHCGSELEVIAKAGKFLNCSGIATDVSNPSISRMEYPEDFNTILIAAHQLLNESAPSGCTSYFEATASQFLEGSKEYCGLSSMLCDPSSIRLLDEVTVSGPNITIWDVIFKGDTSSMVIRNSDPARPIFELDPETLDIVKLGADCPMLAQSGHIAFDSKRNMYLATVTKNRRVYLVPADGVGATTKLNIRAEPNQKLLAVDYIDSQDLYVFGASEPNNTSTIYIFDPTSGVVNASFSAPPMVMGKVLSVSSFIANNKAMIATCDAERCGISLFDVGGNFQGSVGDEGSGIGQLSSPSYITTVSPGKLLVCDTGNKRLVTLNMAPESNLYNWETLDLETELLSMTVEPGKPLSLAVNDKLKCFVITSGDVIKVFSFR